MPETMPEELPEGYYLENFEFLLNFTISRYGDLLSHEEREFVSVFMNLPEDARKLYVRLSNRKGTYFRKDKLVYPELGHLDTLFQQLVEAELVSEEQPAINEALQLCLKSELLNLPDCLPEWRHLPKAELIECLTEVVSDNPLHALGVDVLAQRGADHLTVLRLLFFGNLHQDMTEFVLHELVMPFETYPINERTRTFTSRSVINDLMRLYELSDVAHETVAADETGEETTRLAKLLGDRPTEPLLARRYDKIMNRLARHLERLGCHEQALAFFQQSIATPARERRARILAATGLENEAVLLCHQMHQSPLNEEEQIFAQSFSGRIAKKFDLENPVPEPQPLMLNPVEINIRQVHERVELSAVEYFNSLGGECRYVENSLLPGIFGLVFWDVIFSPVSGAFFHPFQRGPADLFTDDFCNNRRHLFEQRFTELETPGYLEDIVWQHFRQKQNTANYFVNWQIIDEQLLSLALHHIPWLHMRAVFRRILNDVRSNCSGFPDLIRFHTKGYELIEIKGPGDKIQKNQERWFRFFRDHDIPAVLTNVVYTE